MEKILNVPLGERMKAQYEDRTRYYLPRRTYTIVRVDGKAFHHYTSAMDRPFDEELIQSFDRAALETLAELQGGCLAYLQSDEVSFLLTDFETITTDAWFDGNLQKIVSVAASIFTAEFNEYRWLLGARAMATFDARAFTIPDPVEVENYFIWRQKDWERNSLQMLAQTHYPQSVLLNKSHAELHDLLHVVGVNWAALPEHLRRGRVVYRTEAGIIGGPAPVFTQDREFLRRLIPRYESEVK